MDPDHRYQRCSRLWTEQIAEGHHRVCDESLDAGPWADALLDAAMRLILLRAPPRYLADMLARRARIVATMDTVPEAPLTVGVASVLRGTPTELFLDALRIADTQRAMREMEENASLTGLRAALISFLAHRYDKTDTLQMLSDVVDWVEHQEERFPEGRPKRSTGIPDPYGADENGG